MNLNELKTLKIKSDRVYFGQKTTAENEILSMNVLCIFLKTQNFGSFGSIKKKLLEIFGTDDTQRLLSLVNKSYSVNFLLQNMYTDILFEDKPLLLKWTSRIEDRFEAKTIAIHYTNLHVQNEVFKFIIDSLLEVHNNYLYKIQEISNSNEKNPINIQLSNILENYLNFKDIIVNELHQYIQLGIKTLVCLLQTRKILCQINNGFKSINDFNEIFKIPETTNSFLNIYYKLLYINSLKFSEDIPDIPILEFKDQLKYLHILEIEKCL